MKQISVLAVDVGSLDNIGWWRQVAQSKETSSGRDLDEAAATVIEDLEKSTPVALGFEAPLFVPRPSVRDGLNKQRDGENGRPWCAGAGTGALALGIQHATYVFERIAETIKPQVTFDIEVLINGGAEVLVWEAFVSGAAKNQTAPNPHVHDARVAVEEFVKRLASRDVASDVTEPNVLSTVAASLLAAGLTADVSMLKQSCLVVRAPDLS